MSDQMPDEVWLDTYDAGPDNGPAKMQTEIYTPESVILPGSAVRYTRADLHEQVEAKHDRLRAALQYIADAKPDWRVGVSDNVSRLQMVAQEALGHD